MTAVSVVIPTYNRAAALPRAIDSVLEQTFENFELIVVDDASTDETPEVVESYDDDRISYRRHDQNRGANAARNTGIKCAVGEFISFLDSDDEFHREHLERAVERLQNSPDRCAGVYTSFKKVNDGLLDLSIASGGEVTAEDIEAGNIIGTLSCTTFKSKVFTERGTFDEGLPSAQDLDFYIRVLKSYSMVGIKEILVTKHQLDDSIGKDLQRKQHGFKQILKKHGDVLSTAYKSKQYRVEGQLYAIEGNTSRARKRFRKAINLYPKNLLAYYFYVASLFGARTFTAAFSLTQLVRKEWKKLRYKDHLEGT